MWRKRIRRFSVIAGLRVASGFARTSRLRYFSSLVIRLLVTTNRTELRHTRLCQRSTRYKVQGTKVRCSRCRCARRIRFRTHVRSTGSILIVRNFGWSHSHTSQGQGTRSRNVGCQYGMSSPCPVRQGYRWYTVYDRSRVRSNALRSQVS